MGFRALGGFAAFRGLWAFRVYGLNGLAVPSSVSTVSGMDVFPPVRLTSK